MNRVLIKKIGLTTVLGIYTLLILGQNPRIVSGKIFENDSTLSIGSTVLIKGTNIGTVTDLKGCYNIAIPDNLDRFILQYSLIGFHTKEVSFIKDSIDSEKFHIKQISYGR